MYGSESWVGQKKNESRINAVEMRSLRSTCGVSRKDRYRNSDVREQCGIPHSALDIVTRAERDLPLIRIEAGTRRYKGDAINHRTTACRTDTVTETNKNLSQKTRTKRPLQTPQVAIARQVGQGPIGATVLRRYDATTLRRYDVTTLRRYDAVYRDVSAIL
ncbi:hypothetical protein EVAR_61541_1 [Eumeta japonica]|uniref:Uncharacterized protein n=1 Tax=Eumeta variegata TaxID=151549 RepID=A0A4C1ZB12_EUMVA|nr:hypothetical protein EVAR_61541_1 [Eumeta japonica]